MILRTATPGDYDRIAAVPDDWRGRSVSHALPRLFLDHFHATSAIAEADGDLAGFLIGLLSPRDPGLTTCPALRNATVRALISTAIPLDTAN